MWDAGIGVASVGLGLLGVPPSEIHQKLKMLVEALFI